MKRKLTLSIDEGIIELAKLDNLNISQLLEDYLKNYLQTNSTEEIDNKIKNHEQSINALNERKKQLLILGINQSKIQGLSEKIMGELKGYYKMRQNQGLADYNNDLEWLNTPKNIRRCKIIGKTPIEILSELRE